MPTIYIETSIISYLRQRPSSQIIMAARQLLTHQWWNDERSKYELVTSQYVLDEAAAGDVTLAAERMEFLGGIPLLPLDAEIEAIANAKTLSKIHDVLNDLRIPIPIICTPEEMVGDDSEE